MRYRLYAYQCEWPPKLVRGPRVRKYSLWFPRWVERWRPHVAVRRRSARFDPLSQTAPIPGVFRSMLRRAFNPTTMWPKYHSSRSHGDADSCFKNCRGPSVAVEKWDPYPHTTIPVLQPEKAFYGQRICREVQERPKIDKDQICEWSL